MSVPVNGSEFELDGRNDWEVVGEDGGFSVRKTVCDCIASSPVYQHMVDLVIVLTSPFSVVVAVPAAPGGEHAIWVLKTGAADKEISSSDEFKKDFSVVFYLFGLVPSNWCACGESVLCHI